MKNKLASVRLTVWFFILFTFFLLLTFVIPETKLDSAVLTLFSVNSFLYGFYVSPIINYQKSRIEELHKLVRSETNNLFEIALSFKSFKPNKKEEYKKLLADYIKNLSAAKYKKAEDEYEMLITKSLEAKDKDENDYKIFSKLIANQQNRTLINMWLNSAVYSNEWLIISVLFSVTVGFILVIEKPDIILINIITALICSGLSLLVVTLYKYSNLTHKKAKSIWKSAIELKGSKYHRIF